MPCNPSIAYIDERKNEELYTAVLSAVHSFIPEFNSSIAVCDFEKASQCLQDYISLYNHRWLLVSFTQAVYHKVKELGLCKSYKVNKEF